jgi:integrase
MPTIWNRKYGFQLRVSHKLLPKDFWATFDTRDAAEQYGQQLEALLAQGVVPAALLERGDSSQPIWTLQRCVTEYLRNNPVPDLDVRLLDTILVSLASVRTDVLNYDWAERWVDSMKREDNLAPSTIRHRHGALARCFDWMLRKHADIMAQNPLRLLKRGFATYTDADAQILAKSGQEIRVDEERDRRLEPEEETRIQGDLEECEDDRVFFNLALESAMRMRECYTLHREQLKLAQSTIALDRTKNGDNRQVPMSSTIKAMLSAYMASQKNAIEARL